MVLDVVLGLGVVDGHDLLAHRADGGSTQSSILEGDLSDSTDGDEVWLRSLANVQTANFVLPSRHLIIVMQLLEVFQLRAFLLVTGGSGSVPHLADATWDVEHGLGELSLLCHGLLHGCSHLLLLRRVLCLDHRFCKNELLSRFKFKLFLLKRI